MEIRYKSTRGDGTLISASQAVLQGLAPDGGLYVPDAIPSLDTPLQDLYGPIQLSREGREVAKVFREGFDFGLEPVIVPIDGETSEPAYQPQPVAVSRIRKRSSPLPASDRVRN